MLISIQVASKYFGLADLTFKAMVVAMCEVAVILALYMYGGEVLRAHLCWYAVVSAAVLAACTVLVFGQIFALVIAIGPHAC
jgi:hypothetical protein